MGEPSFHMKCGVHTKSADDGQHETEGGAALTAVQFCGYRDFTDGKDYISALGAEDVCTQCPQAVYRGLNIPVCIVTPELGGIIGKGCTDQEAVCQGFRWNDFDFSPK